MANIDLPGAGKTGQFFAASTFASSLAWGQRKSKKKKKAVPVAKIKVESPDMPSTPAKGARTGIGSRGMYMENYTPADLDRALDMIHRGASVKMATEETNVPGSTIRRKMANCQMHNGACKGAFGPLRVVGLKKNAKLKKAAGSSRKQLRFNKEVEEPNEEPSIEVDVDCSEPISQYGTVLRILQAENATSDSAGNLQLDSENENGLSAAAYGQEEQETTEDFMAEKEGVGNFFVEVNADDSSDEA
jgi:hypothetical protein